MLSYCCRKIHDCATEPKRTSEDGFYPMRLVPFLDKMRIRVFHMQFIKVPATYSGSADLIQCICTVQVHPGLLDPLESHLPQIVTARSRLRGTSPTASTVLHSPGRRAERVIVVQPCGLH